MTILAGAISKKIDLPVPDSVSNALRKIISRNEQDDRVEFQSAQAFFVKVDIGAFGSPAHRRLPSGAFAVLTGEPLLTGSGLVPRTRDVDFQCLQDRWGSEGDIAGLCGAAGTFCAAFHDPASGISHLVTDRLGLRTLYYAVVGECLYFATALRILEALAEIPKTMDSMAVAELTGFGYPFGSATPYAEIKMMLPGELVTIRGGTIESSRYFQWDAVAPIQVTEEEAMKETHRLFQLAVRRRLRGDKTTFAYLSGGLDSRCTVAALIAEHAKVYTFNFSLAKTQDQVFALEYANKSGAIHHELPTEPGPNWSAVMASAWQESSRRYEQMPEHPNVVWTGEGGSVGLGHVYISPDIVRLLRAGDLDGAIEVYLREQNKAIVTRILAPELASQLQGHLHACVRKELEAIHHPDPVRAFYIFLNLNGPRRHLVNHFDTIDQHRLEFQVPFYDSQLLEYLTAIAVDPCLYHKLYVKWLSLFDPGVSAVPWQAYPGHVPSPVPIPADLPDQWHAPASVSHRAAQDSDLLDRSAAMLKDRSFPSQVLRRGYLQLMRWAWQLGLGDYGYAMKVALTYERYYKIAGGRIKLPGGRAERQMR